MLLKSFYSLTSPRSWAVLFVLLCTSQIYAQSGSGFSGGVTPARFEISSEAGEKLRRTISIYNLGDRPQTFNIYTSEWNFSEQGELSFSRELADQSCREWVRLERHNIKILPSAYRARKYRFEIQVPENAPAQECRFAIMIETTAEPYEAGIGGSISLPSTGKIAVIVYLGVGDVSPKLKLNKISSQANGKEKIVFVNVTNQGSAHDRMDGEFSAVDKHGVRYAASIATSPIMPGQTRNLRVNFIDDRGADSSPSYPIKLKGRLFSANETFDLDTQVE